MKRYKNVLATVVASFFLLTVAHAQTSQVTAIPLDQYEQAIGSRSVSFWHTTWKPAHVTC
jgi:hypothetical protein